MTARAVNIRANAPFIGSELNAASTIFFPARVGKTTWSPTWTNRSHTPRNALVPVFRISSSAGSSTWKPRHWPSSPLPRRRSRSVQNAKPSCRLPRPRSSTRWFAAATRCWSAAMARRARRWSTSWIARSRFAAAGHLRPVDARNGGQELDPTARQIAVRVAERALATKIKPDPEGLVAPMNQRGGDLDTPGEHVPLAFGYEAAVYPSSSSAQGRSARADVHALLFEGHLWAFVRGRRLSLVRGPIMLAAHRMVVAVRTLIDSWDSARPTHVRLRAGGFQIAMRKSSHQLVTVELSSDGGGDLTATSLTIAEAALADPQARERLAPKPGQLGPWPEPKSPRARPPPRGPGAPPRDPRPPKRRQLRQPRPRPPAHPPQRRIGRRRGARAGCPRCSSTSAGASASKVSTRTRSSCAAIAW